MILIIFQNKYPTAMVQTAVISVSNASTASLSLFHDQIISEVPRILGRWAFELKIFRSNNSQASSSQTSFLFNVNFEHENNSSVTIIDNTSIVSTSTPSINLIESGAAQGAGAGDPLDLIIQTKLQSLWLIRQTLKVENGYSYELVDGDVIIRAVNVFLNGNFKNFLIIVEDRSVNQASEERFNQLIQRFNLPRGNVYTKGFNNSGEYLKDLAYQVVQSLQF